LVRGFLGTDDFVFTGSPQWNALGLGATGVGAVTLVYNKKRTGEFTLGKRRLRFRRVAYPSPTPPPEWFAVDLLRHHAAAGVDQHEVLIRLRAAVEAGRLDLDTLLDMAKRFGRRGTVIAVCRVVATSSRREE
jgi:hypothetical protein